MKKWFMMIVGGLALMAGSVTSSLAALSDEAFKAFVDGLTANTLTNANQISASLKLLSPVQVNSALASVRALSGDVKTAVTNNFFNGYIEVLKDPVASKSDAAVATFSAFSAAESGAFDKLVDAVAKTDPTVGVGLTNVFAEALRDNALTTTQINQTFNQIASNTDQLKGLFAALTPANGADPALALAATRLVVAVAQQAANSTAASVAAELVLTGFPPTSRDAIADSILALPAGGLVIGPVVDGVTPTPIVPPTAVTDVATLIDTNSFDRPISPA